MSLIIWYTYLLAIFTIKKDINLSPWKNLDIHLSGIIRAFDDSLPIEGVQLFLNKEPTIYYSDKNGEFSIQAAKYDTLIVFKHRDFQDYHLSIKKDKSFKVI